MAGTVTGRLVVICSSEDNNGDFLEKNLTLHLCQYLLLAGFLTINILLGIWYAYTVGFFSKMSVPVGPHH